MSAGESSIISLSTHPQVCQSLAFYVPPIDGFLGTSDEHLSLLEHLAGLHSRLSAVVVTTPQAVALMDAIKCVSFTRAVNLPVLGLIENMSGYVCPCCGEISNVFSVGGGEEMARKENLRFLGSLPVDTELVGLLDAESAVPEVISDNQESFPLLRRYNATPSAKIFKGIVKNILDALANATGKFFFALRKLQSSRLTKRSK